MVIIGCDYHPSFQQIAFVDTETGELEERRLQHREKAEKFYRDLTARGAKVRVGMEASGHARWFERLLRNGTGDAAQIRAQRVHKQKTDRQDAQHILGLLLEDRFPRIWVPSWKNRDMRQLLWHRHRTVQARTWVMNQLQAVAPLQEVIVAGSGTEATGDVPIGTVGQSPALRCIAVTRPTEPNHHRANASD